MKINVPLELVWEYNQDLLMIPDFHPRVSDVELVSGHRYRESGATYKCYLKDGEHNCTEQDIEVVPMEKIVTSLPEDTMGLSRVLKNYIVETHFAKQSDKTTLMEFKHFYNTPGILRSFLNLIIKLIIARQSIDALTAIKTAIEKTKTFHKTI